MQVFRGGVRTSETDYSENAFVLGRKIPNHLENPIDNLLIHTAEIFDPVFYALGFTPNILTIISGMFGIGAVYMATRNRFLLAGFLYFISYTFDCFDGFFARKHDMVTEFGDWLDHVKDWVVLIMLLVVIAYSNRVTLRTKLYSVIGLMFMLSLSAVFIGCQEIYYHSKLLVSDDEKSGTLRLTKKLCPKGNLEDIMSQWKWLGLGTMNLYIFIILWIMEYLNKTA
jgi:phosphatidylglycerophosphate synthase